MIKILKRDIIRGKEALVVLLLEHEMTREKMAKTLGIGISTLYKWLEDEDVKRKVEERRRNNKSFCDYLMNRRLEVVIGNIVSLATNADSEKVQLEASKTILAYQLGTPTQKVEQVIENKNANTTIDLSILGKKDIKES